MNLSATLNFFKFLGNPPLGLPHATVNTFKDIPVEISKILVTANGGKPRDIRAIVLDKDNCFAKAKENVVYKPYEDQFRLLRERFFGPRLLIVSNSAGTNDDHHGKEAEILEAATGVEVFRHSTKKPGCAIDVLNYLRSGNVPGLTRPDQIVVVGDRLFTDVIMANMMGAWSIWVKDGVRKSNGVFATLEKQLPTELTKRGYLPPKPRTV